MRFSTLALTVLAAYVVVLFLVVCSLLRTPSVATFAPGPKLVFAKSEISRRVEVA